MHWLSLLIHVFIVVIRPSEAASKRSCSGLHSAVCLLLVVSVLAPRCRFADAPAGVFCFGLRALRQVAAGLQALALGLFPLHNCNEAKDALGCCRASWVGRGRCLGAGLCLLALRMPPAAVYKLVGGILPCGVACGAVGILARVKS